MSARKPLKASPPSVPVRPNIKNDIGAGAGEGGGGSGGGGGLSHHRHTNSSSAPLSNDKSSSDHPQQQKNRRQSIAAVNGSGGGGAGMPRSERDILLNSPPAPRNNAPHHSRLSVSSPRNQIDQTTGAAQRHRMNESDKAAIGSRVWKNDSAMTFGTRVMLAEKSYMWADCDIAEKHLVDVWEHYDVNGDGVLNKNEVAALSRDIVDRVLALYKETLKKEHPDLSVDDIEKEAKKELPHLLPGKDVAESKRLMQEYLTRELDIDHDGIITKTEFFIKWKLTSKQLLTFKVAKAIACNIL